MIASAQIISSSNGRYLTSGIGYWTGEEENEKGELKGQWHGSGSFAKSLHLEGEIERNDRRLDSLMQGKDPNTGEVLRKGAGTTRIYVDKETGEEKKHRSTSGVDIVFSAPKDVSLLAFLSDDKQREKIEALHRQAILTAFKVVQENAYRRLSTHIEKAEIVAGLFQHTTSREGDSQLHSHLMVLNTARSATGTGALDIKRLIGDGNLHLYGAIYRNELEHGLRSLGFQTETVKLQRGESFRITSIGLTDEIRDHFSKRSTQIDAYLEANPGKSRQEACLLTRQKKEELVDRSACFKQWKAEAESLGYDLRNLNVTKEKRSNEPTRGETKANFERKVLESLHRKEAFTAITKRDVENAALRLSQGHLSSRECKQVSDRLIKSHLHEIGTATERWKRGSNDSDRAKEPIPLRVTSEQRLQVREHTHRVQSAFSSTNNKNASSQPIKEKQNIAAKDTQKLYTLNHKSRLSIERESLSSALYYKVHSHLSPLFKKLLPKPKEQSYLIRKQRYEQSLRKYEQRTRAFKRKILYLHLTGKLDSKQYKRLRDGEQSKSKLVINAKWLFGRMGKKQRDYLIRSIDREQQQPKVMAMTPQQRTSKGRRR